MISIRVCTVALWVAIALAMKSDVAAEGAIQCAASIAKEPKAARTVFLAGGDAWDLFSEYLRRLESDKQAIDLSSAKVHVTTKGGPREFSRGGLFEMFGGTRRELWEADLKGVTAEVDGPGLDMARKQGWDIMCPTTVGVEDGPASEQVIPDRKPVVPAVVGFKAGMQYASQRDYKNALKEFSAVEKTNPGYPKLQINIGVAYMQLKDYVQAIQHLTKALDQDKAAGKVDPDTHYNMACVQAHLGQKDDAVRSLEEAIGNGLENAEQLLKTDSDLVTLRGHPGFQDLLKRTGRK